MELPNPGISIAPQECTYYLGRYVLVPAARTYNTQPSLLFLLVPSGNLLKIESLGPPRRPDWPHASVLRLQTCAIQQPNSAAHSASSSWQTLQPQPIGRHAAASPRPASAAACDWRWVVALLPPPPPSSALAQLSVACHGALGFCHCRCSGVWSPSSTCGFRALSAPSSTVASCLARFPSGLLILPLPPLRPPAINSLRKVLYATSSFFLSSFFFFFFSNLLLSTLPPPPSIFVPSPFTPPLIIFSSLFSLQWPLLASPYFQSLRFSSLVFFFFYLRIRLHSPFIRRCAYIASISHNETFRLVEKKKRNKTRLQPKKG